MDNQADSNRCDVCGWSMYDPITKQIMSAINIDINMRDHEHARRIKRMFGKLKFTICWPCALVKLGIPVIPQGDK